MIHQLTHGGVQKTLISALNTIDYDNNEVTLYVRKNKLELLDDLNPNIKKVIINEDKTHYYRKFRVIILVCLKWFFSILKWKKKTIETEKRISDYINESKLQTEKKKYFSHKNSYDVAIAYISGYSAKLVSDYVDADRKIMFYHLGADENHELHNEIIPKFDAVIGVSENVKNLLCTCYPMYAEKFDYIENYINADEVINKSKVKLFEDRGNVSILCTCGRFTKEKGFLLAVEAAKQLKEKEFDYKWYFVGDGAERISIENLIQKYGLEKNIVVTGIKANPYPYIANADIYVQPSLEEAYGLTIKEAMILCKPVISTDTIGGRTLIEDGVNGLLVSHDSAELANRILDLASCQEMQSRLVENLRIINFRTTFFDYQKKWGKLLEGVKL